MKEEVKAIEYLENILSEIKDLKISKYHIEKIQEVINFELELIKREVFISIGKEQFEKTRNLR